LVEGGAKIAQSFLDAKLVDRLVLFQSQNAIDAIDKSQMVLAPITPTTIPDNFVVSNQLTFGQDIMYEYGSRS
jgi:diaminohydroxyphosphoribosylaminopyrimidine deaminase/5-amino-6-(5-phosphoribosylamino)uracil reductase